MAVPGQRDGSGAGQRSLLLSEGMQDRGLWKSQCQTCLCMDFGPGLQRCY